MRIHAQQPKQQLRAASIPPPQLRRGRDSAFAYLQQTAGNRAMQRIFDKGDSGEETAAEPLETAPEPKSFPSPLPGQEEPPELMDAPTDHYIVPFDRNPLVAPGERVIFRGEFNDSTPGDYQLEYSTTGGNFTSATGPTSRTIAGLRSGNVDFFVPAAWTGTTALSVTLIVRKISDSSVARTVTWTFGLKTHYPTTVTQTESAATEFNLPGIYHYTVGPALPTGSRPFYQHQTILERFANWTLANIAPADIAAAYRTAHSLNSAADVSAHFLGNYAGNNGTFTVNASDQFGDRHGGHPNLANLVTNLAAPKDIEVALPQTYEARPGTALGRYTITRILRTDGTWKVRKG